jgi:hypothetical protein
VPQRFAYLGQGSKATKKRRAPELKGEAGEQLDLVYLRPETLRAVWAQLEHGRTGNLSELIEDLLAHWLYEYDRAEHRILR